MEATNNAVTGFRAWAATYDRSIAKQVEQYSGMSYEEMLRRVADSAALTPGAQVLDVGIGTGALAMTVADRLSDGQVTGIDATEAMLRQAEENVRAAGLSDRIELRQAWAESLPFADASFDAVVSSIALHHTSVRQSLREMARVLRPGGRLAVADMSLPHWPGCLLLLLPAVTFLYYVLVVRSIPMMRAEMAALRQAFHKEQWEVMLRDAGFASIEVREFRNPAQRWYPSMLIIEASK